MNNSALIRIVIWAVVAILLVYVLVLGLNGKFPIIVFNNKSSIYFGSSYTDSEKYSVAEDSPIAAGMVQDIELNWVSGSVTVMEYDGAQVLFEESSMKPLEDDSKMHYYLHDGKLIVQFTASKGVFPSFEELSKDLTMWIPKGHRLKDLEINSVSANIKIDQISGEKIELESVSGRASLVGTYFNSADLEAVSGDLSVENSEITKFSADNISGKIMLDGSFYEIDTETVSGATTIAPGSSVTVLKAEAISGGITIVLPENMGGFTVKHSSISGDIRCDFPGTTNKNRFTYLDGGAEIEVETVSGGIDILIRKD